MYTVKLQAELDILWTTLKPVKIGGFGRINLGKADIFILVEENGMPIKRIDFYYRYEDYVGFRFGCGFDTGMVWKEYVVVGAGQSVFFVDLTGDRVISYDVISYFGSMKATDNYLFATSAESLYCFTPDGSLWWCCGDLGIDGVVITSITGTRVYGEGEWDPPGDWRPFAVDINSGQLL